MPRDELAHYMSVVFDKLQNYLCIKPDTNIVSFEFRDYTKPNKIDPEFCLLIENEYGELIKYLIIVLIDNNDIFYKRGVI